MKYFLYTKNYPEFTKNTTSQYKKDEGPNLEMGKRFEEAFYKENIQMVH